MVKGLSLLSLPSLSLRFPFKNLVFQGGGVKSYGYHGVLRVLEAFGILPQIERVAGTSAGAIQATLLSFRLGAEETIKLYQTLELSRVRQAGEMNANERHELNILDAQLERVRGNLRVLNRLVRRFGVYPSGYLANWLEETIAAHCEGHRRATFAEFRERGFRDLYIIAVNVSRHREEIFSAEATPDVAVADAALMSGSIPFFFEAIQFDGQSIGQGDYYVDGGLLSNFPLNVFDDPRFEATSRHFTYGVNWETLGCRLYTPKDCEQRSVPITNLINYAENLMESISEMQNATINYRAADRLRTIEISNCCVSPVDFDIRTDMSDPKYREMVESGEQTAREYLENYRLPTDRFADIKEKLAEFITLWH